MLISIITICYNSEKTIERTLNSMLNQTFKNYEYLIVDGASKDNTLQIVKKYEPLFEGRLKIISEPDKGIYDAMNKGINIAKGDLIGIINSDDYYEEDALEIMNFECEKAHRDGKKHLVLYGMVRILENGKEAGIEMYHHENLDRQMIHHPACFVEKDVYDEYGGFDLKYKSAADYDLMMRFYHKSEVSFIPVYKMIADFERGGMSSGGTGQIETAVIRNEYGLVPKSRITYEKVHAWLTKVYRKIK